jgi:hypothetical protein
MFLNSGMDLSLSSSARSRIEFSIVSIEQNSNSSIWSSATSRDSVSEFLSDSFLDSIFSKSFVLEVA